MAKHNPWFRMYCEFATDAKVQKLSEAMQRRYVMLLCLCCMAGSARPKVEDIEFHLRLSDQQLKATYKLLLEKGLIEQDWTVVKWDERQYLSDTSTPRTRKWREQQQRLKQEAERAAAGAEQPGDVPETSPERPRNAPEAEAETETESEPGTAAQHSAGELSQVMRRFGINSNPAMLAAIASQGVTPATVAAACEEAKRAKPNEAVGAAYVVKIMERWKREADQLDVQGARPRAGHSYQSRTEQQRSFNDQLTGKARHEPADRTIIDLN